MFKQQLAAGDRDTVHDVLKWLLSQGQATLEKRAFVGFHLSLPEVRGGMLGCMCFIHASADLALVPDTCICMQTPWPHTIAAQMLPLPCPPFGLTPPLYSPLPPHPLQMPDELFYDPQAVELRSEIKALQAEFVDVHRAMDAAQDSVRELPALRAQIHQMQDEKERLADKVDKAAAQAAGMCMCVCKGICTGLPSCCFLPSQHLGTCRPLLCCPLL